MKNKHEIEKIAYELYQRDGCVPGRELDHWIEAECIFHSRLAAVMEPITTVAKKAAPARSVKKAVSSKETKGKAESKTAKKMPVKTKPRKAGSSQKEASL